MNDVLLITRPRHDETTNYLYYWAEQVIKEAKKKNFNVIDLKEVKANSKDFSGRMKKIKPDLVFLNGHGSPDDVTGHNNEVLVSINKNEDLLKDKIVYALSCSSAKNLGKSSVAKGAKCFIGYEEDFVFLHEKDKTTMPDKDKTAELFLEPSNLVMKTLIKGNSAGESSKRSKDEFKRNIRKLLASESPQEDKSSVQWLYWDMLSQVCLGDTEAKL